MTLDCRLSRHRRIALACAVLGLSTAAQASTVVLSSEGCRAYNQAILQRAPILVVASTDTAIQGVAYVTVRDCLKGNLIPGDTSSFISQGPEHIPKGVTAVFAIWPCGGGYNGAYAVGDLIEGRQVRLSVCPGQPRPWPAYRDSLIAMSALPDPGTLASAADACVLAAVVGVSGSALKLRVMQVLRSRIPPDRTRSLEVQLPAWYRDTMRWESRLVVGQTFVAFLARHGESWATLDVGNPLWSVDDGVVSLPIVCPGMGYGSPYRIGPIDSLVAALRGAQ